MNIKVHARQTKQGNIKTNATPDNVQSPPGNCAKVR